VDKKPCSSGTILSPPLNPATVGVDLGGPLCIAGDQFFFHGIKKRRSWTFCGELWWWTLDGENLEEPLKWLAATLTKKICYLQTTVDGELWRWTVHGYDFDGGSIKYYGNIT